MKVESIKIRGFRNLTDVCAKPGDGVNIIYGENAQGKTNLMEAIWLFTGGKSFRGAKEQDFLAFGGKQANLELEFQAYGRQQSAAIHLAEKKETFLNEIKQKSISQLSGEFCAVVFSPVHLSLIKDGPQARRKFIDSSLSQIKNTYYALTAEYGRTLKQRNALLKDVRFHADLHEMFDIYEERLSVLGGKLIYQRIQYIEALRPEAAAIYHGLSSARESLHMVYMPSVPLQTDSPGRIAESLRIALKNARSEDILTGSTSVGPHRDDLELEIDGISARRFGSQGQQRSCVLALKLGEASVLKQKTGEQPIALLDDVMSELDESRQDYILHHIAGWQVFITCCDPAPLLKLKGGAVFEMKQGNLTKAEQ